MIPENGAEYEVPFELTSGAVIRTIAYPSDYSDELVGPTVDLTVLKSQTLTGGSADGSRIWDTCDVGGQCEFRSTGDLRSDRWPGQS